MIESVEVTLPPIALLAISVVRFSILLLSSHSHTDVHSFLNIRSSVCYTMQLELVVHIVPIVRRFGGPFSQAVVSPSTAFNYYSLPFLTNSSSA